MKPHHLKTIATCLFCFLVGTINLACKKLISIDKPINTITTEGIFSQDATANAAMAGVYSSMINGTNGDRAYDSHIKVFSAGLSTCLAALSSDELHVSSYLSSTLNYYGTNQLTALNAQASVPLWTSAYDVIYKANSVIEGIAASKAPALHDDVRKRLTGEAKFIRAFSYFYLCNFFGDVPMVLTVDFNQTARLPKMPKAKVYQQIIADLKDAEALLLPDYSTENVERVIPNKWAATLLLARVYLYTGDYTNAATSASTVINNPAFILEPALKDVFSTTSREVIWQLKQTAEDGTLRNATPEGTNFLPYQDVHHGRIPYTVTSQFMAAYEAGDQRKLVWLDSTDYVNDPNSPPAISYYPFKYITGIYNADSGQPQPQYYVVFRLAEAYLIRAEAAAHGAGGGLSTAIKDLNSIRDRADLNDLNDNLNQQEVINAVARERRIEFFAEWGHRWFDLKRTGQASTVLPLISAKQPWLGDYQLLYPIPTAEITADRFLLQNPGY